MDDSYIKLIINTKKLKQDSPSKSNAPIITTNTTTEKQLRKMNQIFESCFFSNGIVTSNFDSFCNYIKLISPKVIQNFQKNFVGKQD
jgi:hypothetical protein